jgi:hypothetical protein
VDRNKYQIHLPLPPKIDPSVTMMQVEEKPDVTYSDVGGCKEQIEKLREVVELPLLNVRRLYDCIALEHPCLSCLAGKIRQSRYRTTQRCASLRATWHGQNVMCTCRRQSVRVMLAVQGNVALVSIRLYSEPTLVSFVSLALNWFRNMLAK